VREEVLEFMIELGGKRLVCAMTMAGRLALPQITSRWCKSCDPVTPEQTWLLLTIEDAPNQSLDGARLIAAWGVVAD